MTRYDLLYAAALPLLAPYLTWRRLARGKYNESYAGMLGRNLPSLADAAHFQAGSVWLHAVSVGEVNAARAIAPGLRALMPQRPMVVSTITETGQAHARRLFAGDAVTYFPADYSRNVRRFLAAYNPAVFTLLETELWPNFLMLAHRRGTRCFMVNGKLSDRSFPRYRRFQSVLRPAFDALAGICTQTERDAERFAALGVPPDRIRVTGNCKFDLPAAHMDQERKSALRARLGMSPARRWIIAGSTHPTEEALILDAFAAVAAQFPDAGLLLCPRHPERFDEVARLVEQSGRPFHRTSRLPSIAPSPPSQIILLDQMGILADAYALAEIALVAGSWCPVGGHNLLEAAVHEVPVVFGPDLHSQREIDRLFRQAGAGLRVDRDHLAATLLRLLQDEPYCRSVAAGCLAVAEQNRGSADRSVEALARWLNS